MKSRNIYQLILSTLLMFAFSASLFPQDEQEKISPFFDFSYLKDTDNHRILTARIYTSSDIAFYPYQGLTVKFYTGFEEQEVLGEAVTDESGYARFVIDDAVVLPADDENNWSFSAVFEGDESYEMAEGSTSVTDVNLDMTLLEDEEGNRSAYIEAYRIIDGERIALTDESIGLYVPRMFSLLTIGEGDIVDGSATIDVPAGIPGDPSGNLTIMAKFIDHWNFGNVEKSETAQWGVPSSHEVAETHRALWTQIAPKWMIVTLTILLVGVWSHYIYAILSMFWLKKAGKKAGK